MSRRLPLALSLLALMVSLPALILRYTRTPDVAYVTTPPEVVAAMLRLSDLDGSDVLYDLGCGDGRIPITAAQEYGVRAVCVDIDPDRIKEATENARKAGVADRVQMVEGDLFEMNLRDATAVTLYLLPELNLRLMPKLLRELKPGTPIVSHEFPMGDWKPEVQLTMRLPDRTHTVYKWRVPSPPNDEAPLPMQDRSQ